MKHIQREELNFLLLQVYKGSDPYKMTDKILDLINEKYNIKP